MFNKKRIIIFFIFILLMFFMMTFAGAPTPNVGVNTRHVTFTDGFNGKDIAEYDVEVGKGVTPPKDPYHKNYVFSGWFLYSDHDVRVTKFDKILNDLHVIALYGDDRNNNGIDDKDDTYFTVSFINSRTNEVLKSQSVLIGMDASAPNAPSISGYTFVGWDKSYRNIQADLNVYTVYRKIADNDNTEKYTVTFVDGDTLATISKVTVEKGLSATAPNPPKHENRVFDHWEGSYTNVTSNRTVTAIYKDDKNHNDIDDETEPHYDINFTSKGAGKLEGVLEYKDILTGLTYKEAGIKEPTKTPKNEYYEFKGWDESFNDNTIVSGTKTYTGTFGPIKDNNGPEGHGDDIADEENEYSITINYLYKDDESVAHEKFYEKRDYNHLDYNVTSPTIAHYHVDENQLVVKGTIADDNYLDKVVTVYYNRDEYTVTFVSDGKTIKEEKVLYNDDATAPENPTKPATAEYTYTFTGWDKEFTKVSEDLTVTALYSSEANPYTLTITYTYSDGFKKDDVKEYTKKYDEEYSYTTPEVTGYTADKTTVEGKMPAKDESVKVTYTPNTNTSYVIEFYQEDLNSDEFSIVSKDTIETSGTTNTAVTLPNNYQNKYEGFEFKEVKYYDGIIEVTPTNTINPEGTTVVKIYYTRSTVEVVVDPNCEGDSCTPIIPDNPDNPDNPGEFDYGDDINLKALERKYNLTYIEEGGERRTTTPYSATFKGYCKNTKTCSGSDLITAPATVKVDEAVEGKVTFYAQWEEETIEVEVKSGSDYQTAEYDYTFSYWKDHENENARVDSGAKITLTKDRELEAEYTYVGHEYTLTITYKYSDGFKSDEDKQYTKRYNDEYSYPTPEVTGYTADKTAVEGTMPADNVSVTVTYNPNERTAYKVKFFKEDLNANTYTEITDDELTRYGKTNTQVVLTNNEFASKYEGFTINTQMSTMEGNIEPDGSLVLSIYYDRDIVEVVVDPNCEGDSCTPIIPDNPDNPDNPGEFDYGDDINLKVLERKYNLTYIEEGGEKRTTTPYSATFKGYCKNTKTCSGSDLITAPATVKVDEAVEGKVTFYAQWEEETIEVEVKAGSDYETAEYDYTFSYWKDHENENARVDSGAKITLTKDRELEAEYTHVGHEYTVTLISGDNISYTTGAGTYRYGTSVNINAVLETIDGYTVTFADWNDETGVYSTVQNATFDMPAKNITLTARATKVANDGIPYSIRFFEQNREDDNYTEVTRDRINSTGVTDTQIVLPENYQNKYTGFDFKEVIYKNDGQTTTETTINGNGKTVVEIYYDRHEYTVTLVNGDNITATTGSGTYRYEAPVSISATLNSVAGYTITFADWNKADSVFSTEQNATFNMPNEDITLTARAIKTANTDTPYTVEKYYQERGTYTTPVGEERTGTTGQTVSLTDADKTAEGYIVDETQNNVFSATLEASGTVLKVYFKKQYTVTFVSGEHGTFENATTSTVTIGNLDYNSNTPQTPTPVADEGYHFENWTPELEQKVINDATYTANFAANTDTAYKVEFYYQGTDGTYSNEATSSSNRTGTTGESVNVTDADKNPTQDGYVFDTNNTGNVLTGTIAGDGSTTLKVYFKLQLTVEYKKGTHGTFTETTTTVDYNATRPDAPETTGEAGWVFDGWDPELANNITENVTYTAKWVASDETPYTVEFYYEENGEYPQTPTSTITNRVGTTDEAVSVTDADKTPTQDGYVLDTNADNVFSDEHLNGDGTTVLKVYFKQEFTVTFNPGEHGTFEVQTKTANYNDNVPEFTGNMTQEDGYEFVKWVDQDGNDYNSETKVTKNLTYTAQWELKKYTVKWNEVKGSTTETVETDSDVSHGAHPEFNGTTPTYTERREDGNYTYNYTFVGWKDQDGNWLSDSTVITKDTTYTAQLVVLKAEYKPNMQNSFTRGNSSESVEDRITVKVVDSTGATVKTLSKGEYTTNFDNSTLKESENLVINYNYSVNGQTYALTNNELYYSIVIVAHPSKFEANMSVENAVVDSADSCRGNANNQSWCNVNGVNGATMLTKDHNFLAITEHYLQNVTTGQVVVKYKNGSTVKLVFNPNSWINWSYRTGTGYYDPTYIAELKAYDLVDKYVYNTGSINRGETFPAGAYRYNAGTYDDSTLIEGQTCNSNTCSYSFFTINTENYNSSKSYYDKTATGYTKSASISAKLVDVEGVGREIETVTVSYYRNRNVAEGENAGYFKVIFELVNGQFIPIDEVQVNSSNLPSDYGNSSNYYTVIGSTETRMLLNRSLMMEEVTEEELTEELVEEETIDTIEENAEVVTPSDATTEVEPNKETTETEVEVNPTETETVEEKKEDAQSETQEVTEEVVETPKEEVVEEPVKEEVKEEKGQVEVQEEKVPEKTETKTEVKVEKKVEEAPKVVESAPSTETTTESLGE